MARIKTESLIRILSGLNVVSLNINISIYRGLKLLKSSNMNIENSGFFNFRDGPVATILIVGANLVFGPQFLFSMPKFLVSGLQFLFYGPKILLLGATILDFGSEILFYQANFWGSVTPTEA